MPDVDLSVTISRELLGLDPLQISDVDSYYVAAQFLGGQVTWNRQKVSSPWLDGEVTTARNRQNVTEQIGVEIRADTNAELQAATAELIAAFCQDSFVLTVIADGGTYAYAGEAADYQVASWTTPRLVALAGQVVFSMPRQPVPLIGAV